MTGRTTIGSHSRVFSFASIGHEPQDLKFRGEATRLSIGNSCTIRENVTIHTGTLGGGGLTLVGNNCLLMARSHVGHDCQIGNGVVMANHVLLGGHVTVGDFANIGGGTAVQQFVRLGHFCRIGGLTALRKDVIPYGLGVGSPATIVSMNIKDMRRRGLEKVAIIDAARFARVITALSTEQTLEQVISRLHPDNGHSRIMQEISIFRAQLSHKGICALSPSRF